MNRPDAGTTPNANRDANGPSRPARRWSLHRPSWRHHPGVRHDDELTLGERAADKLRNGMGSWGFVFGALVFLAGWMLGNRNVGFDKYRSSCST